MPVTTVDRLDRLFQHCWDLGIEVEWDELGDHRRGHYEWRRNSIVLNVRLTMAQVVSTLAHEIGHAIFGDRCSTPAAERRAWEFGAALAITPAEYEAAEGIAGHHPSALAMELEVTPRLIEAWRQWYEKRYPIELHASDGLTADED